MIKLTVPFFPPSVNEAYFVKFGRMHLSTKGKKFKTEVSDYLTRTFPTQLKMFKKNKPYGIYLRIYMESLENKGWPEKCATRYKVFDATNRIKLAEDALKVAFGIDDSQHIFFTTHKLEAPAGCEPFIEVLAWSLEEEVSPFDALVRC